MRKMGISAQKFEDFLNLFLNLPEKPMANKMVNTTISVRSTQESLNNKL